MLLGQCYVLFPVFTSNISNNKIKAKNLIRFWKVDLYYQE